MHRPTDTRWNAESVLFSFLMLIGFPAARTAAGEQIARTILTLGADGNAPLYSVSGISADSRGNVYVTDVLDYSVKKFDRGGRYIGKIGHRGNGRGEFKSPSLSLVSGGNLVVIQVEDPRIQVFDTGFVFRNELTVRSGMPVDIADGGISKFTVALLGDSARGVVLTYPENGGDPPARLRLEPTGRGHFLYSAVRIARCRDGRLVAAYLFMNRVEVYGRGGALLKRFSVEEIPGRDLPLDEQAIPEDTYFRKVVVDRKGDILLLGGNQAPHPGRDVFVCRTDGSYLRTYVLPEKSRLIAAGDPGTLYATDVTGTRVLKYALWR